MKSGLRFTLLTASPDVPPLHNRHAASCLRRWCKNIRKKWVNSEKKLSAIKVFTDFKLFKKSVKNITDFTSSISLDYFERPFGFLVPWLQQQA